VAGDWPKARECQFKIDRLWTIFRDQYPSSLKGGMALVGRPVGPTRRPLPTASKERIDHIATQLEALGVFATEPYGW
jgi:4-hydroxy-tetrahydrodipicolinate synthase